MYTSGFIQHLTTYYKFAGWAIWSIAPFVVRPGASSFCTKKLCFHIEILCNITYCNSVRMCYNIGTVKERGNANETRKRKRNSLKDYR